MSQYLERLPIGGEMEVKGPLGHFHYIGRSRWEPTCINLHRNSALVARAAQTFLLLQHPLLAQTHT